MIPATYTKETRLSSKTCHWHCSIQGQQLPLWLQATDTWAGIFQSALTTLGIIAGGVFAYFKFVKTREFAKRVEPEISVSRVTRRNGNLYIEGQVNARNVGISMVRLERRYSKIVSQRLAPDTMEWVAVGKPLKVLRDQEALESGEAAGEPVLIQIPDADYFALKLTFSIAASRTKMWWGRAIINFSVEDQIVE